MGRTDWAATRKAAEKEGLIGGGDYLKLVEGSNRMRIMTEPVPHPSTYKGEKRFKWLLYVVDRSDGEIKPFFMPHSIYKMVESLQTDPEYSFEETPIPYDVTINAKNAGTKEVEYSIFPARTNTPVTPEEMKRLAAKKPIKELGAALRAKDKEQNGEQPPPVTDTKPFDPDEVPF